MQPVGGWQKAQLADRCILRREFGDALRPAILELRRSDPWNGGFDVAISVPDLTPEHRTITAGWLPAGRLSKADLPNYGRDERGREWIIFPHGLWSEMMEGNTADFVAFINDGGLERYKEQIEQFYVADAYEKPLSFKVGKMSGVSRLLDQCMRDMLIARGVDPLDIKRESSRAVPRNFRSFVPTIIDSIPQAIRDRERPSLIEFMLYVNSSGRPTSCHMVSLPYFPDYEELGCDLLMDKAEFGFLPREKPQQTFYKLSFVHEP